MSPVRLCVVVLLVLAVQEPAVGAVRFRYQPPVWPMRVSVAELWVTELAVKGSFVVVSERSAVNAGSTGV